MASTQHDESISLGGQTFENASEYVRALQAAIRNRSRRTDDAALEVQINLDGDLPLVQRTLLR